MAAAVIVGVTAAHGILMKYVYAYPPPGMDALDVRAGAESMYFSGAYVEAVLVIVFCLRWYRAAGRLSGRLMTDPVTRGDERGARAMP